MKPIAENPQVVQAVGGFVGDVAKTVLEQGELSAEGIKEGIINASKKRMQKSGTDESAQKTDAGSGVTEDADEQEVPAESEQNRKVSADSAQEPGVPADAAQDNAPADIDKLQDAAQKQTDSDEQRETDTAGTSDAADSIDERIEIFKKLKKWREMGIISQEEFEEKSREILGI